jgi:hypothetical protein
LVSIILLPKRITPEYCKRIQSAKISGKAYILRIERSALQTKERSAVCNLQGVLNRLLTLKIRDFHRAQNETEEYNREWSPKCGQKLLIPTKERTVLPHVEADKSASDPRPAS